MLQKVTYMMAVAGVQTQGEDGQAHVQRLLQHAQAHQPGHVQCQWHQQGLELDGKQHAVFQEQDGLQSTPVQQPKQHLASPQPSNGCLPQQDASPRKLASTEPCGNHAVAPGPPDSTYVPPADEDGTHSRSLECASGPWEQMEEVGGGGDKHGGSDVPRSPSPSSLPQQAKVRQRPCVCECAGYVWPACAHTCERERMCVCMYLHALVPTCRVCLGLHCHRTYVTSEDPTRQEIEPLQPGVGGRKEAHLPQLN